VQAGPPRPTDRLATRAVREAVRPFMFQGLAKTLRVARVREIPDNVRFPKNGTVIEADTLGLAQSPLDRAAHTDSASRQ
jgi:hypothetical protein